MNQWIGRTLDLRSLSVRTKALRTPCLKAFLIVVSVFYSMVAMSDAQVLTVIPDTARVWENRSGEEGSDYTGYRGDDIAFVNSEKGAWYHFVESGDSDGGQWHLFHQGPTLDFANSDDAITEALQYEVISGTAFFENGPPGMYQMKLDGLSGELITRSNAQFNPDKFEALNNARGQRYYYHLETGQWWSADPDEFGIALNKAPSGPYYPRYIRPGSLPSVDSLNGQLSNGLTFDIPSRRYYKNGNANSVAGFHESIASSLRQWDNESDMPCSPYAGYPGNSVVYVSGVWYSLVDEGGEGVTEGQEFRPFLDGRYLSFEEQYPDTDFLEYALVAGTQIGDAGSLSSQQLRLDGETGALVDESGQAVSESLYHSPNTEITPCGIKYTILLNEPLKLKGLAGPPPFIPSKSTVSLVRVVPLRNVNNDPFNDRTIVLAVNQARAVGFVAPPVIAPPADTPVEDDPPIVVPPIIAPVPGSCPVNSSLVSTAMLPAGTPLENIIGISSNTPASLSSGFTVTPQDEAIRIASLGSLTHGTVSMGGNFSYVSGASLGSVAEATSVTYRVRRNSDSAEFEVTFRFNADIVFDDPGIILTSLSARQCTVGGPL